MAFVHVSAKGSLSAGAGRFCFYSGSKTCEAGKGAGEAPCDDKTRLQLTHFDREHGNFRQMLSNFGTGTVTLQLSFDDGALEVLVFPTAEHAFHALKFYVCTRSADLTRRFARSSSGGASLVGDDALCARRNRKLVVLNKQQLAKWDARRDDALLAIWAAKFTQNSVCKVCLLCTGNAALVHIVSRSPVWEHWVGLERIREALRNEDTELLLRMQQFLE